MESRRTERERRSCRPSSCWSLPEMTAPPRCPAQADGVRRQLAVASEKAATEQKHLVHADMHKHAMRLSRRVVNAGTSLLSLRRLPVLIFAYILSSQVRADILVLEESNRYPARLKTRSAEAETAHAATSAQRWLASMQRHSQSAHRYAISALRASSGDQA